MINTLPNPLDLEKITVKITCTKDEKQVFGSGTLVLYNKVYYVLTAAHCLCDDQKIPFEKNNIAMCTCDKNKLQVLNVDYLQIDDEEDYAVVKVSITHNIKIPSITILQEPIPQYCLLEGVPGSKHFPKNYIFRYVSENIYQYSGPNPDSILHPEDIWDGMSGGGLFCVDGNQTIYMIGYLKGHGDNLSSNNEFKCFSSVRFMNFLTNLPFKEKLEFKKPSFEIDSAGSVKILIRQEELAVRQNDMFVSNYINRYQKKFSKIKTFLYPNDNLDFYDVYFPLTIKLANSNIRLKGAVYEEPIKVKETIDHVFVNNNAVSIIASAGAGKTMLMKHIFLTSLRNRSCNGYTIIPVMVELRNLNDKPEVSIKDYIRQMFFVKNNPVLVELFEDVISSGQLLIIFDGYDEIDRAVINRRKEEICKLVTDYNENRYLLTSRPDSGADNLEGFVNFNICTLEPNEVDEFIDLQLRGVENGEVLSAKLKNDIKEKNENAGYQNYIKYPLLLSMLISTFTENPKLPDKKSTFYKEVFNTLESKHDARSKSGGFIREKKSKLTSEQIEVVLRKFSAISYKANEFNFTKNYLTDQLNKCKKVPEIDYNTKHLIDDLTSAICILIKDGNIYSFPHRSMQEYFFACFIERLGDAGKERIYKELINHKATDRNIWELLLELDKNSFIQYYVLPILHKFIETMNEKGSVLQNYFSDKTIYIETSYPEIDIPSSLVEKVANFFGISPLAYSLQTLFHEKTKKKYHIRGEYFIQIMRILIQQEMYFKNKEDITTSYTYKESIHYISRISHIVCNLTEDYNQKDNFLNSDKTLNLPKFLKYLNSLSKKTIYSFGDSLLRDLRHDLPPEIRILTFFPEIDSWLTEYGFKEIVGDYVSQIKVLANRLEEELNASKKEDEDFLDELLN